LHDAAFKVSLVAVIKALRLDVSIIGSVNHKSIGVYPKFTIDFVATVGIPKHQQPKAMGIYSCRDRYKDR
jgi:hypothetical protein